MTNSKTLFRVATIDGLTEINFDCDGQQELFRVVASFFRLAERNPIVWKHINLLQEVKDQFPQFYKQMIDSEVAIPDFDSILKQNPENNI